MLGGTSLWLHKGGKEYQKKQRRPDTSTRDVQIFRQWNSRKALQAPRLFCGKRTFHLFSACGFLSTNSRLHLSVDRLSTMSAGFCAIAMTVSLELA